MNRSTVTASISPYTQDYIAVKEKYARYMPHSAGRSEAALRTVLCNVKLHL